MPSCIVNLFLNHSKNCTLAEVILILNCFLLLSGCIKYPILPSPSIKPLKKSARYAGGIRSGPMVLLLVEGEELGLFMQTLEIL